MRFRLFVSILFAVILVGRLDAQLRIATNVDTVLFSTVKIGFSRDGILEIRNTDSVAVAIRGMSIIPGTALPSEFSIVSPSPTNFILDSGSSKNVLLRFRPIQNDTLDALLQIVTDEGIKDVRLIGFVTNTQPDIVVIPDTIDFGGHVLDNIVDTTYLIIGGGIDSAYIYDINVANDNAGIYFQAYPKDITITFPRMIGPNDTIEMTAHFEALVPLGVRTGRAVAFGDVSGQTKCEFKAFVAMPEFEFTEQVVDLGVVQLGSSVDTVVFLKSIGDLPVSVENFLPMTLFQPNFPSTPLPISPNDSLRIPVHFDAIANGPYQEALGALAKVTLSGGKYRSVLLKALVMPQLLESIFSQDVDVSCAFDSAYTSTIILRDTGSQSVDITKITTDSLFDIRSGILPMTLQPGDSLTLDIIYTHKKGETGSNTAIVEYYSGEYIIHRDTVRFVAHQEKLPFTLALRKSASPTDPLIVDLFVDKDINKYNISRLEVDAVITPSDVADLTLTLLSPDALLTNNIITFLNPLSVSSKEMLLSIAIRTYVSQFEEGLLTISLLIPGEEGCILVSTDTVSIQPASECGDESIRRFLRGEPLIGRLVVPSIVSGGKLKAIVENNLASSARMQLVDILGAVVTEERIWNLESGSNTVDLNISHLPSGIYFLRMNAADAFGHTQTLTQRFIIER